MQVLLAFVLCLASALSFLPQAVLAETIGNGEKPGLPVNASDNAQTLTKTASGEAVQESSIVVQEIFQEDSPKQSSEGQGLLWAYGLFITVAIAVLVLLASRKRTQQKGLNREARKADDNRKKASSNAALSFKGYYVRYNCPLCGGPKSPPDIDGQSILWIATECIRAGAASSSCHSCGKTFTIPASVFADGVIADFKRISELPGDQLWSYVDEEYVKKNRQSKLLKPDWYEILLKANESGAVDTMSLPWDPSQPCPNCGSKPYSSPISFTYACPFCGSSNTVAQQSIDPSLGVRVSCYACLQPIHIPPQVWCPKCRRALVDYHQIIKYIAAYNGIDAVRLLPR